MGFIKRSVALLGAGALLLGAAACGGSSTPKANADGSASELRLGYFANITHATAIYGVSSGIFQKDLGSTKLTTKTFNAGPETIEALRGGALDAAFLGPNPAINGFTQTNGSLLRIVAGTTSGGASLIVQPSITDVSQLSGKKVATPQVGNTQDVAAKFYFKTKNVKANVVAVANADVESAFTGKSIAGAWVPEPYASRLVLNDGGKKLVDEATLWPGGKFVTTQLVVTQTFLKKYPSTVEGLLKGLLEANDKVATKSADVQSAVNDAIKTLSGKALKPAVLASAFLNLSATVDPIATSLKTDLEHGVQIGVSKQADLKGIYDLTILNKLLTAAGKPTVDDAGLGVS
ncbi:MAG: sulfonate transport system substrate-binding protein [Frankiales bacterium]|nr:sulfonate transport system substrate-binding protein [Frankiales bacterium]